MKEEKQVKERNLVVASGLASRRSGAMVSSLKQLEESKKPLICAEDENEARPICRAFEYCKENCTDICHYLKESE